MEVYGPFKVTIGALGDQTQGLFAFWVHTLPLSYNILPKSIEL